MKLWGDESGLFWEQPIKVGRTSVAGTTTGPKPIVRKPLPPPPEGYRLPDNFPDFSNEKRLYFDLETYDPELMEKGPGTKRDGYIVGWSLCTDTWNGDYYPVRHANGPNLDAEKSFQWLRDNFKNFKGEVVGTNLLYESEYVDHYEIQTPGVTWRPIDWAEALLDENQFHYGLEYVAQRRLGRGKVDDELVRLYGEDYKKHFQDVHPGHAKAYGLGDVHLPRELFAIEKQELEKENLLDLYDMECRLTPFLLYMRRTGVRVDIPKAEQFNGILQQRAREELEAIRRMVGFEVNVDAAQSIARAFDVLGLPYPHTAKDNPSFTAPWLENHDHPIASHILRARAFSKTNGTFISDYIENNINGYVFGQFHPLKKDRAAGGTVTGRFSSSNPNLQNIPVRDEELGPMCRGLFIPWDGHLWWSLDYSQIEYRLLVHYALLAKCFGADKAAAMYWNNPDTDFHQLVADLTGVPRKKAKNINFGFVYGMGVWLLAHGLGLIDSCGNVMQEARDIFAQYHGNALFIKQVYQMAADRAQSAGFVRTILGRKRRFNLYEPYGFWKQVDEKHWERTNIRQPKDAPRPPAMPYEEAVAFYGTDRVKRAFVHKALNAVLQGSAADMMKRAMVLAWEAGCFGPGKPLQCHLTVHDELDGSMEDTAEGREALEHVREIMINAVPLKVPVLVSGSTGANWAEAK